MVDPKIYLAIDNCFASKRWSTPKQWLEFIKDCGVNYIEASADNELDPLYMGTDYCERWAKEVNALCKEYDMKIANCYSGHGTYATLGMGHYDDEVADRITNNWVKEQLHNAKNVDAGLGFFCHAFSVEDINNKETYAKKYNDLINRLSSVAKEAKEIGSKPVGLEQMYSPNQVPWTIEQTKEMIKEIYKRADHPMYITIDTGHQVGQNSFLRPDNEKIKAYLEGKTFFEWLGQEDTYNIAKSYKNGEISLDDAINKINKNMDEHPYLFSKEGDGDTYLWLKKLGGYSPIVHLQQTKGTASAHLSFTEENNKTGSIFGEKVLLALKEAYETPQEEGMPPYCEEIYLTLELFFKTAEYPAIIEYNMKKSVEYFRQFIPEDGMRLSELIGRLK